MKVSIRDIKKLKELGEDDQNLASIIKYDKSRLSLIERLDILKGHKLKKSRLIKNYFKDLFNDKKFKEDFISIAKHNIESQIYMHKIVTFLEKRFFTPVYLKKLFILLSKHESLYSLKRKYLDKNLISYDRDNNIYLSLPDEINKNDGTAKGILVENIVKKTKFIQKNLFLNKNSRGIIEIFILLVLACLKEAALNENLKENNIIDVCRKFFDAYIDKNKRKENKVLKKESQRLKFAFKSQAKKLIEIINPKQVIIDLARTNLKDQINEFVDNFNLSLPKNNYITDKQKNAKKAIKQPTSLLTSEKMHEMKEKIPLFFKPNELLMPCNEDYLVPIYRKIDNTKKKSYEKVEYSESEESLNFLQKTEKLKVSLDGVKLPKPDFENLFQHHKDTFKIINSIQSLRENKQNLVTGKINMSFLELKPKIKELPTIGKNNIINTGDKIDHLIRYEENQFPKISVNNYNNISTDLKKKLIKSSSDILILNKNIESIKNVKKSLEDIKIKEMNEFYNKLGINKNSLINGLDSEKLKKLMDTYSISTKKTNLTNRFIPTKIKNYKNITISDKILIDVETRITKRSELLKGLTNKSKPNRSVSLLNN